MSDSKEIATKCSETIYLQYDGKEAAIDSIIAAVREDYDLVKKGIDSPQDIKIYLKPHDGKAYYVINNDYAGEVPLPLE